MNLSKKCLLGLWPVLGFYRGSQYYNSKFYYDYKRYLSDPEFYEKYDLKPEYSYSYCVLCSTTCSIFYTICFPAAIFMELNAVEMYVRRTIKQYKQY